MIKIGSTYIAKRRGGVRLCADIVIKESRITLWFGVENKYETYLCLGRADAFVMAFLPTAIRQGQDIVCEEPISEQLQYQLNMYLIPAIVNAKRDLKSIRIYSPITCNHYPGIGAVGTHFLGDIHSFYTIMTHDAQCQYPLTHITVFNSGVFKEKQYRLRKIYRQAQRLAEKQNLQTIYVDTNFHKVFHEKYIEVASFRDIACALALQGLFSVYLFSSKKEAKEFKLDFSKTLNYDLLVVNCASTESLTLYCSGAEVCLKEKMQTVRDKKILCKLLRPCTQKHKENNANRKKSIINIGKPYIEEQANSICLCAQIKMCETEQIMWFSVKKEYGKYLTEDRADAFVVGLFMAAMRNASDIICEAPVTRCLLYQLNHYLIPMMSSNMDKYHCIKIHAEPNDFVLQNAGAVGTGWTAGVDCMFSYMQNLHTATSGYKLTHLLVANNGAIEGDSTREIRDTFKRMVKKTEDGFASEAGLSVIGVETNLQEIVKENFIAVVGIRQATVILALQKLFSVFLDSSSYSFNEISFDTENLGYYEWVAISCLATENTKFYYSGGTFSRGQKLKALADFSLAQRYLHPCVFALKENCGRCAKCTRTEAALYGLGILERFSNVFDVEAFEKDKDWYFEKMLLHADNLDCKEALDLLQKRGVDLTKAKRRIHNSNEHLV